MSAAIMTRRIAEASPRFLARMAGLFAVLTTPAGFALIVTGNLVDPHDAAATAHHILANEQLYRLAVAGDVLSVLYVVYTLFIY